MREDACEIPCGPVEDDPIRSLITSICERNELSGIIPYDWELDKAIDVDPIVRNPPIRSVWSSQQESLRISPSICGGEQSVLARKPIAVEDGLLDLLPRV
ncbi:hypothetical protein Tdes44962_MAKER02439 [Teratosphaeria destructans]|uniref:Uncharacterized protein n=1 Tax=Teratosphaeria destructans TaxID=418781 RepID=A0A9W7ST34_9PEZI|nr:hypothetical protein Tdes44962_MAKER02439 [Teratosphaeria destructans]